MLVVVETLLGGGGGGGECEQTQASNGIQAVMTKINYIWKWAKQIPPSHVFAYLLCFASNSGNNRMSVTNKE